MEFGKHLTKSLWGLADKALPVAYGIGYVYLVIRVLPDEEFGNFVLLQEIFLILSGLAAALALQPLLKFGSEDQPDDTDVLSVSVALHFGVLMASSLVVTSFRHELASILNAPMLAPLLVWIPALLGASFIRNTALVLLQTRFQLQRVFWVDAAHFLGAPLLVWIMSRMHQFDSAMDLIVINVVSLSLSSAVGLVLVRTRLQFGSRPGWDVWKRVSRYGMYSFGSVFSYLLYSKADSFVLAAYSGPVTVALYNSAKIFTRIFEMATQVVQMLVLPSVSFLSSRGEEASLKALVEKAIMFSTIGMVPVLLLLLAGPELLIDLLYGGRYAEAAGILRIFALMSLTVSILAIGSSVLMGLGEARASFFLGVQTLVVSVGSFFLFIPWLGVNGAAVASVVASVIMTWVTLRVTRRYVQMSTRGVLARVYDIRAFITRRFDELRH